MPGEGEGRLNRNRMPHEGLEEILPKRLNRYETPEKV
jgi:hypothetical protein